MSSFEGHDAMTTSQNAKKTRQVFKSETKKGKLKQARFEQQSHKLNGVSSVDMQPHATSFANIDSFSQRTSTDLDQINKLTELDGNPSLMNLASAYPPDLNEFDSKDPLNGDLSPEELACINAQALLMHHIYGSSTVIRNNKDVLALIQQMGQGPARDQALNSDISLEELDRLIEKERRRAAENLSQVEKNQSVTNDGPSIVVTDSDDALAINLPNTGSRILESVHAINAGFNLGQCAERGRIALSETADLSKSMASQSMLGSSIALRQNAFSAIELAAQLQDKTSFEAALTSLAVSDACLLGSSHLANQSNLDPDYAQMPQGIDFPDGYPVAIPKLKALVEIGMTLEMVQQYLYEHRIWNLQLDELQKLLEVDLSDLRNFLCAQLDPCYPIIYVDTVNVRMLTRLNLVVEHPFYIFMGLNLEGDRKLLSAAAFPKQWQSPQDQEQMWLNALGDLKKRGLRDPIYLVTGNVEYFKNALHTAFPKAIYQVSIYEILRRAQKNMDTNERGEFSIYFRSLYNSKSLLECMKALERLADPWKSTYPEAIQIIKDHFLYFEQYFAANPSLRICLRTTRAIDGVAKDLRRDMREDTEFRYQDALHVLCRIIEIDRYVTRNSRPVQWKRAIKAMLDDLYTGTILNKYLDASKIRLPRRN